MIDLVRKTWCSTHSIYPLVGFVVNAVYWIGFTNAASIGQYWIQLRLLASADPSGANPVPLIFDFTARRYASAVYAVVECRSVCLPVTSQHCTKTAEHRITQTTPHVAQGF